MAIASHPKELMTVGREMQATRGRGEALTATATAPFAAVPG